MQIHISIRNIDNDGIRRILKIKRGEIGEGYFFSDRGNKKRSMRNKVLIPGVKRDYRNCNRLINCENGRRRV